MNQQNRVSRLTAGATLRQGVGLAGSTEFRGKEVSAYSAMPCTGVFQFVIALRESLGHDLNIATGISHRIHDLGSVPFSPFVVPGKHMRLTKSLRHEYRDLHTVGRSRACAKHVQESAESLT